MKTFIPPLLALLIVIVLGLIAVQTSDHLDQRNTQKVIVALLSPEGQLIGTIPTTKKNVIAIERCIHVTLKDGTEYVWRGNYAISPDKDSQ